jgi:hypothetical protein
MRWEMHAVVHGETWLELELELDLGTRCRIRTRAYLARPELRFPCGVSRYETWW